MLSAPIGRQRFKPIAGERRQVSKLPSGVELPQLPLADARPLLRPAAELAAKQRLGLRILERPDHAPPMK